MPSVKIEHNPKKREISVDVELPVEMFERYIISAIKHLQKEVKLDGFRPGSAPAAEVLRVVGESAVLEHAAEHAIQEELPKILAKEHAHAVSTPQVMVKKLARGNPLQFTAHAPLAPEVVLPDYKKIAENIAKIGDIVVSDEEYNHALTHLRRERARITKIELGVAPEEAAKQAQSMEEKDLPALDDEFVKTLGFENMEKFSDSMRVNMKNEKERLEVEKRRAKIFDTLVQKSEISYPAIFKELELDDMEARLKTDLERMQSTFEKYLEHVKKTREELRKEWDEVAEKRAKIRMILVEIAKKEGITAEAGLVDKHLEYAQKTFPNTDPDILRANIIHTLQNEAVLKFLEGQV